MENDLRQRIAETEYAVLDPRYVRPARFGTFYSHPAFPDRYDANQLCRVACSASETPEMLSELEDLYAGTGLGFRKVSGYDPEVWGHLEPTLREAGWQVWTSSLMLGVDAPIREPNPDVEIRAVPPDSSDLESLYRVDGELDRGFELARGQFRRLGGEYLVGHLDSRPACCTGWYAADRVARFRHVLTAPWARGRGCATTLILHVKRHPIVRSLDGLVILVDDDGPEKLYRDLGFRHSARFWEARTRTDAHRRST